MQWPVLADPFFAQRGTGSRRGEPSMVQSIGEYLDGMPRQVAYILSQLEASEMLLSTHGTAWSPESSDSASQTSNLPSTTQKKATGRELENNEVSGSIRFDEIGIAPRWLPFASAL
jgi:hypothetical protein